MSSWTSRSADALFENAGAMTELYCSVDWAKTPLGPVESWPRSLKTCVRIVLTSRQAMFVWWGDHLINLYNEAYRAILGGKHPTALGQPAPVVWREIWNEVGPRSESAMRDNTGTYDEALLLIMERNGYQEETYYTFSYSPVPNDEGGTGGIICANTDDTRRIVGGRELLTLRELAARATEARTVSDAGALCARALTSNARDLPFALIYLHDPKKREAVLAGAARIEPGQRAAPATVPLDGASSIAWPLAEVLRDGQRRVVVPAPELGPLPRGAWEVSPREVVALPIPGSVEQGSAGVLVVGVNPFRLLDDTYLGFLGLVAGQIGAAVTSARAYDEEKRRAQALAALDREKTVFFSNVSHEFRTPLTLMLSPLEEALASPTGSPTREQTALVHRNGLRLLKLVNSLLDFARIEAGRAQASHEPLDLALVTSELASMFRSVCEKAGLRLVVTTPPLSEPVYVDRDMWEKIVLNLLSNAFKFTFEGAIEVSLVEKETAVELSVADSGIGIAESDRVRLFERFHRVEGAPGRTHEGTGIGLALVQELVKLHGGSVRVESAVGRGTTFHVTIPKGTAHLPKDRVRGIKSSVKTTSRADAYVEEALRWLPDADDSRDEVKLGDSGLFRLPTEGGEVSARDRARVLIADDNADMRSYMRRLLSDRYEVEVVPDGEAALAAAKSRLPDLILSDVMMPRLDGFGLIRELRREARTQTIPVILLSARAGEESRIEGIEAGADDYIVKPFGARELLARVSGQLELVRVRRLAALEVQGTKEEFSLALEAAQMGAWRWNLATGKIVWSAAHYRLLGYEPDSVEPTWDVWKARAHPDDVEPVRQLIEVAVRENTAFTTEYRLVLPDGTIRWVQAHGRRQLADEAGHTTAMAGVLVDVTERRRVEEALKEADRRKDEFLAMLGHELRNPLAPIMTALAIVKARAGDREDVARPLGVMSRQTQHLARLVDDLLEVSRITRGKIRLEKKTLDAATVVSRAVELSRPLIDQRQQELTITLPTEPLALHADLTRLAQILGNLLNNAAKYTDEKGRIWFTVEREKGDAVFRVRDNGIGIPRDLMPRLFELFSQADTSLDRSQGGLGIGLTLVRGLVGLHDGTVEALSEGPGKGSEFVVRIPALAEPPGPRERTAAFARLREMPSRRVVVVDDNRDAADSLADFLTDSGHVVTVVYDGAKVLEIVRAQRPDVVVLDIGLPGMDGYAVARQLRREAGANLTLIALTGYGQEEDRRKTAEAGFDHHLVKPLGLDELPRLLEGQRARDTGSGPVSRK